MMTFTAVCSTMLMGLGLAVAAVIHLLYQLFLPPSSPIACFYSWACYIIRCRRPGLRLMILYINFFLSVLKSSHSSSCGHPPALPTVPGTIITNCLLLQLGMLHHHMQIRWPGFGLMIFYINFFLSVLKFSHSWTTSSWKLRSKCPVFVVLVMRLSFSFCRKRFHSSPQCSQVRGDGEFLLKNEDCILPASDETVPNGLIIDLDKFRTENYLTFRACNSVLVTDYMSFLSPLHNIKRTSPEELTAQSKAQETPESKSKETRGFENILGGNLHSHAEAAGICQRNITFVPSSLPNTITVCNNHCACELERMKRDNQRLTSEIQQGQLQHHKDELEGMKEICLNQHATINHLNKSLTETRENLKLTVVSLQVQEQKLAEKTKICAPCLHGMPTTWKQVNLPLSICRVKCTEISKS